MEDMGRVYGFVAARGKSSQRLGSTAVTASLGQEIRPNKYEREAPPGGGTFNSTVYQTAQKPDGSTHYGFNSGSVDGAWHGHVIEESDGSYRYARDADGTEYNV